MDARDRQEFNRLRDRVEELEKVIQAMEAEDKIAEGIATALQKRGAALPLGWVPKTLVYVVSASALGTLILQIVRLLSGN